MSVIFKALIATCCLLMCVVSIYSDSHDNTKFTDKSILPEDLHNTNISPKVTTNRQKRVVVFRPLFVYRQQQIKKTRLNEQGSSENHGSQEKHEPINHQPVQQSSNLGTQEVHHHHHHHHHHHYPEGVQRTYDSRYQ